MQLYDYLILIMIALVIFVVVFPNFYKDSKEGFEAEQDSESAWTGLNKFVSKYMPKRGDVGEFEEETGWRRDPRFFADWADVQRLGVKNDFCRMIEPEGSSDPGDAFFACALAGTENLSGTEFRTETVREGFLRSRDDYMNDITKSGRQDYCRILKTPDGSFQAMCRRAMDRRFGKKYLNDANPPSEIKTLLDFYDGIMMWLRMRDDLVDYAGNLLVSVAGNPEINETPKLSRTEGLAFNGVDQFLRLGENHSMEFGDSLSMRSMRAVSLWVYFDEFTNNAHIFDFGSGAGKNNVFLGIVGRGNPTLETNKIRKTFCEDREVVPEPPSGAQPVEELSPQKLMKTSSANVNDYDCTGFEVLPKKIEPLRPKALPPTGNPVTADLIYEIWDGEQRKMRIKIPNAVQLKKWTHIAITAATEDAFRPDIDIYINGSFVFKFPSGFLPQTTFMTHNYIGKSNWVNTTSQYENRDELFKGSLFDFRTYNKPMSSKKVMETVKWGSKLLGIPMPKTLSENLRVLKETVVPVNSLSNAAELQEALFGKSGGILVEDAPF